MKREGWEKVSRSCSGEFVDACEGGGYVPKLYYQSKVGFAAGATVATRSLIKANTTKAVTT